MCVCVCVCVCVYVCVGVGMGVGRERVGVLVCMYACQHFSLHSVSFHPITTPTHSFPPLILVLLLSPSPYLLYPLVSFIATLPLHPSVFA